MLRLLSKSWLNLFEMLEMKEGPDIARIVSLIGDPAGANVLSALTSGKTLTATVLAH
jgi:hypothetical protein